MISPVTLGLMVYLMFSGCSPSKPRAEQKTEPNGQTQTIEQIADTMGYESHTRYEADSFKQAKGLSFNDPRLPSANAWLYVWQDVAMPKSPYGPEIVACSEYDFVKEVKMLKGTNGIVIDRVSSFAMIAPGELSPTGTKDCSVFSIARTEIDNPNGRLQYRFSVDYRDGSHRLLEISIRNPGTVASGQDAGYGIPFEDSENP